MELDYSKETLNSLGIYELRNLAREVGVYSPTTLVKSELISKILSIISGDDQPHVRTTKQGRPAKQLSGMDNIYKLFRPTIEKEPTPKNLSKFSNLEFHETVDFETKDYEEVSGYVKIQPDNCGILMKKGYFTDDLDENYFIADTTLKKFGLRDGDFICARCYQMSQGNPKVVVDVESVNYADISQSKSRPKFVELGSLYPNKKHTLASGKSILDNFKFIDNVFPLAYGSRALLHFPKNFDMDEISVSFANKLSKVQNTRNMVIALGCSPEYVFDLKSTLVNSDLIIQEGKRDLTSVFEEMYVKVNHYLRLVEMGYNVSIVIANLSAFADQMKKYCIMSKKFENEVLDVITDNKLIDLFNLAKCTQSAGSLTMVVMANNEVQPSLTYTMNSIIEFNPLYYDNTKVNVNPFNSKIKKIEKILTNQQLIARECFLDGLNEENFREKFVSVFMKE